MKSHLTSFGTPGIGAVPYGIHMCQFYPSRQELMHSLVPYFVAGLVNNERCIWVPSSPLPADEARTLAADHPGLQRALASGQLTVLDTAEWYGDLATFDAAKGIQALIDEEARALAKGFQGLRIAGNASFVPREHWERFMEYEKRLHGQLRGRRIVACCSYHRQACQPVDIMEIVHRHDGALDYAGDHWQMFLRPEAGEPASRLPEGKLRASGD